MEGDEGDIFNKPPDWKILFLFNPNKAELFENLSPPPPHLHISRRTNLMSIKHYTIVKQPI